MKESESSREREINILIPTHPIIRKTVLPTEIKAGGLTPERKCYLFTLIREHVWDPYKDITCPRP